MTAQPATRGRGRPPRISRAKVVEAARKLDPSSLTMQAVADELGVDRKTIHYHVSDRDELLQLVAEDAFREKLALFEIDGDADWPQALRSFTTIVRDATLAALPHSQHVTMESSDLGDWAALAPAEAALRALFTAGFDEVTASHLLRAAGVLGSGFARDVAAEQRSGPSAQRDAVEEALRSRPPKEMTALHHLIDAAPDVDTDSAFTFAVDVLIAGARQLLAGESRAVESARTDHASAALIGE